MLTSVGHTATRGHSDLRSGPVLSSKAMVMLTPMLPAKSMSGSESPQHPGSMWMSMAHVIIKSHKDAHGLHGHLKLLVSMVTGSLLI